MKEKLLELRLEELHGFRNHPFQVKDDEAMDALCESIAQYGVLSPLLARLVEDLVGGGDILPFSAWLRTPQIPKASRPLMRATGPPSSSTAIIRGSVL